MSELKPRIKENGIDFQTPFILENKIYDLYLPKYNILIEVDGCYWHSKNVPLSSMNSQQLRRWKNDRFKDSLACKHGYKLLRVWEDEINKFNIHKELIINE
jgi:very-short-patch-repair endonuclease